MKLYHYITKGNSALTEGILSFAKNPNADLSYYYKRTGGKRHMLILLTGWKIVLKGEAEE